MTMEGYRIEHLQHDVAIIGGGPAGAVAARALAAAGRDVVVIPGSSPEFRVGESLVPAARSILSELGIWERFRSDGHTPCHGNCSAWGTSRLMETDFIRSPFGNGWHLDRARFDAMLREMACEAGAQVLAGGKLVRFEHDGERWRLNVRRDATRMEIACGWIIDCTGRSRRLAKALGVERIFADRLVAFFARFRAGDGFAPDAESRTLVESMPWGWLHTALLPSRERVVTLFTDADSSVTKSAATAGGFLDRINESVHVARVIAMHGYGIIEQPRSTDARSSRLGRFHGEGWIAAGDAAIALDPLSSQGIISALHTGHESATALARHLDGNAAALDLYDALVTQLYERFLEGRAAYYGYEHRWESSPFWKSRRRRAPEPREI